MPIGSEPARPRRSVYLSIGGLLVVTCCATVPQLGKPPPSAEPAPSASAPPSASTPPAPQCVYNVPPEQRGPRSVYHDRIVGGKPAVAGAWPGAVAIAVDSGRPYCTGSLIRSDVVLTAAHCMPHVGDLALADSTSLADATPLVITSSRIHPQYDNYTNDFDVAVLRLHAPAKSAPVGLAENLFGDADVPDAMVIGWGATQVGGAMVNGLREVNVPRWSWGDCKTAYSTLTARQTCAGAHGKDSCQGDSGGPLFAFVAGHYEQIGITSYGRGCALEGYPGVYTDVAHPEIRNWIEICASAY